MSLRDGNVKMSKSHASDASRINLSDSPDTIAAKIRKAKTDSISSISYEPKTRPDVSNLLYIYAALRRLQEVQRTDIYCDKHSNRGDQSNSHNNKRGQNSDNVNVNNNNVTNRSEDNKEVLVSSTYVREIANTEFPSCSKVFFKDQLTQLLIEHVCPIGKEIERLTRDPGYIDSVLASGAENASAIATRTMKEVRDVIGML